ncbi:MAG: hypothetical protein WCR95_05470 [Eubacteriales bacterium]
MKCISKGNCPVIKKLKKINLKKAGVILLSSLGGLFLLAVAFVYLTDKKIPTRVVDKSIRFADINYDIDIFEDPIYVSRERNITYLEFKTGELIGTDYTGGENWHGIKPKEVYLLISDEAAFFRDYFICLISGDYNVYGKFFTKNFFRFYSIPEKFTRQKIYDITVDLYDRETITVDGDSVLVEHYIVAYRIMNNNSSFRGDMGSDVVKPLYFKLIKQAGEIKIEAITFINEKKVNQDS